MVWQMNFQDDDHDDEDEEWEKREDEAQDALEQAIQDCGRTAIPGQCNLAGTAHCDFHCPLRKGAGRLEGHTHNKEDRA